MTRKKETDTPSIGMRSVLKSSLRRLLHICLWAGTTIGLLAVMVYGLWTHVRPHVVDGPHFHMPIERIVITPEPPAWIRGDVRAEVMRAASLDEHLSVLDRDLAESLFKAFSLHPWVAKVERVTKLQPAGARVELVYRRPVCMVEVPGGLYPVDSDAYLLPSSDFSPQTVVNYPRLSGIPKVTEGPVGTQWQDPRVQGAARIATVLVDHWTELKLSKIAPSPEAAVLVAQETEYDLFTVAGTCIRWGTPDDHRRTGEPTLAEKVQRLRNYAKQHGSLDARGKAILDVRLGPEILVQPLAGKSIERR